MTINTYATLQSAVGQWLHRSDLSGVIPDFITLAEANINRKLRIREMETSTATTSTGGTRAVALPTNWLEGKRVYLSTNPITVLSYIPPQDYWSRYMSTTSGIPVCYTIEGENILLGPIPDAGYVVNFLYYQKQGALSATAHTVFTNNPDIYLFGALTEAQPYVKDDKRFPLWVERFERAIQDAMREDERDRHSGSLLQMRTTDQIV